jgi:protein-disulfide isomerase
MSSHPTLTPPVSPGRDHFLGPPDARATLTEFGDYECPFCGAAHAMLRELLDQLGDDICLAFRNFPLTQIHSHAQRAAEAAEAAGAQGRFWEMHDLLFENQHALDGPSLLQFARVLELDAARFASELASGTHRARVRDDFMSGVRSGVNGTPTFFINGVRYDGPPSLQALVLAIRAVDGAWTHH